MSDDLTSHPLYQPGAVSPITVQIVRIREIFKTLKEYDIGLEELKTVPELEMNFEEAFKSIADNLEEIHLWINTATSPEV